MKSVIEVYEQISQTMTPLQLTLFWFQQTLFITFVVLYTTLGYLMITDKLRPKKL